MNDTIVIGGSGFIGQAIQRSVRKEGRENDFTFGYNKHPENIISGMKKIMVEQKSEKNRVISNFETAIYVAGNVHPSFKEVPRPNDQNYDVELFMNFATQFRGALVLLSSQSVYYGLEGCVHESIDHVPDSPYGVSKQTVESHAKFLLDKGHLSKLWISRLMYAFGKGEREQRLVPQCANVRKNKGVLKVFGNGCSYLNPLPVDFVADSLLRATAHLSEETMGYANIVNINHPKRITTAEVVRYLASVRPFDYEHVEIGEKYPVRFWGDTSKLSSHLKCWGMRYPDPYEELKKYFLKLTEGDERE
ncbi:MAG: NAD(P)-dependent oxidoreductase [Candidatus Thermoplasmatota archaeon]